MYMYLRHSLQAQGQFMHRLLHGAACRTLELWRAHADQKSTLRRRAQRVVARFTSRALATGFEAWIHSVSQTKRLKMMVAAMLQRKKDCISSILQCWREYTSEVRISTMRIRKAVRRWTNGALCTSLDAWVQLTSDEKRRRYVVRRSVLRMKSRYQFFSWQRWTQAVAERKEVLSKIKILASKRKHPAMDLCFREWRNLMEEELKKRNGMVQILKMIRNRHVSVAIETWYDRVAQYRDARAKQERQTGIRQKFASKMMSRQKTIAFESWRILIEYQRKRKYFMIRIILHMQNRSASSAFEKWRHRVDEIFQERTVKEHKSLLCKRAIARLWDKRMDLAFIVWKTRVVEKRSMSLRRTKGLCWRTKLVTAKALSRWSSRKNEEHRMRNLMSKLVRRMQNAGISQAWQTWREYVHSVLGARKQEERRFRIMKRSLLKILNARMCMVMAKWKNAIKKTFRLRTVATKAILRLQNKSIGEAFSSWLNNLSLRRRLLQFSLRILSRWNISNLRKAFSTWEALLHMEEKKLEKVNGILQSQLESVHLKHDHMALLALQRIPTRIKNRRLLHTFAAFVQVNMIENMQREAKLASFRTLSSPLRRIFSTWLWWLRFNQDLRMDHVAEAIKSASWNAKVRMKLSVRLVSSVSSLWDFVGGCRQVIRILRDDAPHGGQTTRNLVH
eukprot:Tamp_07876.p1 GENE.Tamp_07876~~Tamp_07876.p1  ORF type:complete len:675 (+),score=58.82 Tamp_07876:327-2351(+)